MYKPRIVLFKSKTLADGKSHPLMMYVYSGKQYYVAIGYSAIPDEWNFKSSRYNKKALNFEERNNALWQKEVLADKIMQEMALQETAFSIDDFKDRFEGIKKRMSVNEFNDLRIEELKVEGAIGNMNAYKQIKGMLRLYKPSKNIQFADIDYNFLKGFETFVLSRGTKKSTVHYYMRSIRALYNEAIRRSYVEEKHYPFKTQFKKHGYSIAHLKGDYNPRPISVNDFDRLLKFEISKYPQFEKSFYFFLLLIEARGLNFVDLCNLTDENFINGRLNYIRSKTGKLYNLPLSKTMIRTIEKYKGKKFVYSDMDKAPENLISRNWFVKRLLDNFNEDMKRIGTILGINVKITSYTARYTYTNLLIQKNTPVPYVQQALGHSNIATTQHYIKKFSNEEVDKAVALF